MRRTSIRHSCKFMYSTGRARSRHYERVSRPNVTHMVQCRVPCIPRGAGSVAHRPIENEIGDCDCRVAALHDIGQLCTHAQPPCHIPAMARGVNLHGTARPARLAPAVPAKALRVVTTTALPVATHRRRPSAPRRGHAAPAGALFPARAGRISLRHGGAGALVPAVSGRTVVETIGIA